MHSFYTPDDETTFTWFDAPPMLKGFVWTENLLCCFDAINLKPIPNVLIGERKPLGPM